MLESLPKVGFEEGAESSPKELVVYETIVHQPKETGGDLPRAVSRVHSTMQATIHNKRELHKPASNRSCMHVEIDISALQVGYKTGDHIAVFC